MARYHYSPRTDRTLKQPKESKKRKATPVEPTLPTAGNISLQPQLSDEERRQLRADQIMAARKGAAGMEPYKPPAPIADPDLRRDMEVKDPRGDQGNQVAGDTPFPEVKGPQQHHTRTLPDPDIDNTTPRFAALSSEEEALQGFDNALTKLHTVVNELHSAADFLEKQRSLAGRTAAKNTALDRLVWVLREAVDPWCQEMDDTFHNLFETE